jgi:hypothetical protein
MTGEEEKRREEKKNCHMLITSPLNEGGRDKNIKTHSMELRNPEVFNVDHANTERFQKSAIIYMQHL